MTAKCPHAWRQNLSIYQQSLAADAKVAFWNLHDAMLAQGGMAEMVKAKPSLANLDYTHINFRGGKVMAQNYTRHCCSAKDNMTAEKHSH